MLTSQTSHVVEQSVVGAVLHTSFRIPWVGTPSVITSQRAA